MTAATPWFRPLTDDAPARVFAFPQAGAGPAQLAAFGRSLASGDHAVWAASLPGRQARLDEPPRTDLDELVDELADGILELVDTPYTLLGYCGGAVLALGLARALHARSAPLPRRLIVVAYEAPDIARRPAPIAQLPADRLWAELEESGGIPAGDAADPRLRRLTEAAVRADFALMTDYVYRPAPVLPVPITVCFGGSDGGRRGPFLGWRRQSSEPLDLWELDGGHFLLDDAGVQLAECLREVLAGDAR